MHSPNRLPRRGSSWLLWGVLLVALGLRIPGLFSDFWLDEIWTFELAGRMASAWDVVAGIHHSNNHHLNTLWFYTLGDLESWIPYRLPALGLGVASVAVAWRIGARGGRIEAAVAAGLCATAYLGVHYASEARGYAPVVFFGLASFDVLERYLRQPDRRHAALFWACAVLGFLSHLMYLHGFVAAAAWLALAMLRRNEAAALVRDGLRLFAVPAAFLVGFWWLDLRLMKIGRGPEFDVAGVVVRAASHALGGPASGLLAAVVAVTAATLFAGSIVWWQRRGRDAWSFIAVVILAAPILSLVAMEPHVLFVRYFLLSAAFGLIALAAPLAAGLAHGGPLRMLAAVLLAAISLGNGLRIAAFYEHGRGDYLGTVRAISRSATSRLPSVGGDHRFRTRTLLRFYNRYLPEDRQLVYREQAERPDWLLLHRIGPLGSYAPELVRDETRYELVRVAPYSGLSGWHWIVYRRTH